MKCAGLILVSLIAASFSSPSRAQTPDANSAAPAATKPASTQSDQSTTTPTIDKKKPKKVWTNEEIGSVGGTISVVGDGKSSAPAAEKAPTASSPSNDAKQQQIAHYRDEVQQIRAQMDSIDKRIDQLKNFKGENTSPSAGININQGYNMVPVEEQVKQLEDKKKQLGAKIDDIEADARKNGIDPGDIR